MWQQFAAASVLVLLGFSTALNHGQSIIHVCALDNVMLYVTSVSCTYIQVESMTL